MDAALPRGDDRITKTMNNCENIDKSYFHLQDQLTKDLDVPGV